MRKIIAGALQNEILCEFGLTIKLMKLNKLTTVSYICGIYFIQDISMNIQLCMVTIP